MKRVIDWSVQRTPTDYTKTTMPYVTSSLVEAVTTCPKWGIIHNVQHKRFVTGYRQMALEAGSVMHDVFAAFNLMQIAAVQDFPDHARFHGNSLYGERRFEAVSFDKYLEIYKQNPSRALEKLAVDIIATSDFYDDEGDRNRTLANMEHASFELAGYYLSNLSRFPIYIEDEKDPTKTIGVEKSMDVIFTCDVMDEVGLIEQAFIRFIGLGDVLYQNPETKRVKLGEYKTTSTMGDGWREQFRTRHQQSGYIGALQAYFPEVADECILIGSALPVRKTSAPNMHFPIHRDKEAVGNFLATALTALDFVAAFKDEAAIDAPMFTHSCNRYFRPCALLDLCSAQREDQQVMWEQMVISEEMSPSEFKAFLRKE